MGVESVGMVRRSTLRATSETEPFLGLWEPALLARVLTRLLGAPVGDVEVQRRAISLGLTHVPANGQAAPLTAQAVSRLFLAAYRVPAHVDQGTERSLRQHLRADCVVWLVLDADPALPPEQALSRLHQIVSLGELAVVREFDEPSAQTETLSPDDFMSRWEASGRLLLAAAPSWNDLPRQGRSFFAGSRSADGDYHWNTAGCATDARGEILRY